MALWPIAQFQEISQIWQLFFMTGIKMICRDIRQRERDDSDAVRVFICFNSCSGCSGSLVSIQEDSS